MKKASFTLQLLKPVYWPTWLLVFVLYLLMLMPMRFQDKVARGLSRLVMKRNRKRYDVVQTNLKLCFPHNTEAQIRNSIQSHFEYLIMGLLHYGLVWWASRTRLESHVQTDGFGKIDQARSKGKNVILMLSHCTGLEFAVAAITQRYQSAGPYKPFKNPVFDWLIARGRQRYDCLTYTREEGLRPLIKHAREGRVIIYLADEDLGAEVSEFAEFFGIQKATIPVLGRLARSCKAVVLPVFACYDSQAHLYNIKVFDATPDFPTGEQQRDAELMNAMIEKVVRVCPDQYFWTLKLFKTRPAESDEKFYP